MSIETQTRPVTAEVNIKSARCDRCRKLREPTPRQLQHLAIGDGAYCPPSISADLDGWGRLIADWNHNEGMARGPNFDLCETCTQEVAEFIRRGTK